MADDWITTKEAVQISGYHIEHIRRLMRSDQINAKKWGREWMVGRDSLQKYLDSDNKPGPKPKEKINPLR